MKVLNINKFFYIKGGAETYYFELNHMLEKHGHQVMHFSMKHENNVSSAYNEYFINNIDYYKQTRFFQKVKNAGKIVYSIEAAKKLEQLIKKEKPDIAHLQNFHHQLSGSILRVLKKYGIPVVYTAHDLKLICGNYKMLAHNEICEACKGGKHIQCYKRKCVKDSRAGSLVNTIEMYLADWMKMNECIDKIITPSRFYLDKMVEFGIAKEKVEYIPNFINASKFEPKFMPGEYFVYFGRLAEEKGLYTLLEAMEKVEKTMLYIIGTGPIEENVTKMLQNKGLNSKVKMLGYKSGKELTSILENSISNILPSEWYENGPYSVLEMMCMGKPTIAANIGGLPDMVVNEKTGLLFEFKNADDLAYKIQRLSDDKEEAIRMGKNARALVEKVHSEEAYYTKLIQVYEQVM
ncbi:glycosyltransferase family 4 protein [Anaerosacchariphilus polymeriproducens]|uniref:Glycosyltransferase family 1 protein n=1 Tax=Anaerosacchariphilus polymeriproducens TaxID=1812858 RepID=A0A371AZ08_9FIRM|nr:glycosyltransferase family 4 protein [Anaerosacchariphilus polymeriproducens]RDU24786.1 glycosyltransferase family 1 protein [Anaerosacchariphilus polymeriproducens]